ncbi:MAG TPA: hypothetical protein VL125_13860 [Pelobium sp.]|nr:hypothetical protein [Pelobium sp.]
MLVCEIVLAFLFSLVAQFLYKKSQIDLKSILKGLSERLFLTIFMFNNLPHAITFFSALKLATRLKHEESTKGDTEKFNSYYLIGNLISVTVALFYVWIWNHAGDIDQGLLRFFGR